jgi:hypothetical protein
MTNLGCQRQKQGQIGGQFSVFGHLKRQRDSRADGLRSPCNNIDFREFCQSALVRQKPVLGKTWLMRFGLVIALRRSELS